MKEIALRIIAPRGTPHERMALCRTLDTAIQVNLKELGYGG